MPSSSYFLKVVLMMIPSLVQAVPADFTPPEEINVFSPVYCKINQDKFFGRVASEVYTVSFNYQMETVQPSPNPQVLVDAVEGDIADYVLTTSSFDAACGGRRQLLRAVSRRLGDAVGLSVNPPDQVVSLPCTNPTDPEACYVVDGQFQVYATEADQTIGADILAEIESAMNAGDFDNAHPLISKLSFITLVPEENNEEEDVDGLDGNEIRSVENSNGNNTPIYIGAGVGAAVVLGALVFLRRKQTKDDPQLADETPSTDQSEQEGS